MKQDVKTVLQKLINAYELDNYDKKLMRLLKTMIKNPEIKTTKKACKIINDYMIKNATGEEVICVNNIITIYARDKN